MSETTMQANARDILVAKAIRGGYNPYCRSTDKNARNVSGKMVEEARRVVIPRTAMQPAQTAHPAVRELRMPAAKKTVRAHREVVALENFELVERRRPFSLSSSLTAALSFSLCASVLALVVFSGSLINVETRRASELSAEQKSLLAEQKTLTAQLDARYDLNLIEAVAVNDLGMVKVSDASQRYVSLSAGDMVESYDTEEENGAVGMTMLNALGDKIGSALEYLD